MILVWITVMTVIVLAIGLATIGLITYLTWVPYLPMEVLK